MERGKLMKVCFLLIFMLFFLENVKGEIFFTTQFNKVFNVGDRISLNLSIKEKSYTADYLEIFLVCDGERSLEYKKYYEIKNKRENLSLELPLFLKGDCYIEGNFGEEEAKSEKFEVSDEIEVNCALNNNLFFPSETLEINGTGVKKNKKKVEGIVNVRIMNEEENVIFNKSFEVKEGKFFVKVEFSEKISPGKYKVEAEVLEKNIEGKIINKGKCEKEVEIKRVPYSIYIEGKESVKPPGEVSFLIELRDQAERFFEGEEIIIKFFDPENNIVEERTLESGENFSYFFKSNASRGAWSLNAYYGNLFSFKQIYVEENKELKIRVVNETSGSYLEISNVGNIDYIGNVKFSFENSSGKKEMVINLSLEKGKSMKYPLELKGAYNISSNGENLGVYYLTGAAVFVKRGFRRAGILAIMIIVIIVGFLIFELLKRKSKKKTKEKIKEKGVERKVYTIFFKVEKEEFFWDKIEKIVKRKGFTLNRVDNNLSFILFFSEKKEGPRIYKMVKAIEKILEGREFAIVINSGKVENKLSTLKEFASFSKTLLNFVNRDILVGKEVFEELGLERYRKKSKINIKGKDAEVYLI